MGDYAEGHFEMGLLEPGDWSARWICGDYEPQEDMRYPVDCFCRRFSVEGKLKQARLYISARGLYEARINGRKAGDDCFTPGCTDYRKRVAYQVYDVTGLVVSGEENFLEIELADGWYRGCVNAYGQAAVYGKQTGLLCQLELLAESGQRQVIVSDEGFSWSDDGPRRFADLKDGEICDMGRYPSYGGRKTARTY